MEVRFSSTMPRSDLTLKQKIEILDKIESKFATSSTRKLSEVLGVPRTTIRRVILQKIALHEE